MTMSSTQNQVFLTILVDTNLRAEFGVSMAFGLGIT